MIKVEAYAVSMLMADISPLEGVYNISAMPRTVPPPTHVAKMYKCT